MKKLFLIRFSVAAFFCLLCVLPALAVNIKIKGAVKDKLSKEPLIGATIRLLGTQAGAVTDMEGNFELNSMGVLEGMYDIEIKYVLKNALTNKINDREVYMKGIDTSYYYEGYTTFKTEDLK